MATPLEAGCGRDCGRERPCLDSRTVNALRHRLRPCTWLAILATLALALLPLISHARAPVGQPGWAEVCTPQGLQRVARVDAVGDPPATPVGAAGHFEHCPYCAPGVAIPGPPGAPVSMPPLPVTGVAQPPLFLHAPRTRFARRIAQPRGPPLIF